MDQDTSNNPTEDKQQMTQASQETTPPVSASSTPPHDNSSAKKHIPWKYVLSIVLAFLVGGLLVFFISPLRTDKVTDNLPKVTVKADKIVLPSNAIQIQKCANNKGTLYVEPQNIPVGPVYMVHNGEVIGIEYMLSKDEFLEGKSYKFLGGLGLKVDHVNIGLLSTGHEGYAIPHYHVDMYTVGKDVEQKILCPGVSPVASVSGTVSPTSLPVTPSITITSVTASPTPIQ